MPDPTTTRLSTPPGSVVVVRVDADDDQEGTFALAEELHRQTGLPVVVTTPGADLSATTPEEAADALAAALPAGLLNEWSRAGIARHALADLRGDGWRLVRLSEPE